MRMILLLKNLISPNQRSMMMRMMKMYVPVTCYIFYVHNVLVADNWYLVNVIKMLTLSLTRCCCAGG
jgi:hypothetical protein